MREGYFLHNLSIYNIGDTARTISIRENNKIEKYFAPNARRDLRVRGCSLLWGTPPAFRNIIIVHEWIPYLLVVATSPSFMTAVGNIVIRHETNQYHSWPPGKIGENPLFSGPPYWSACTTIALQKRKEKILEKRQNRNKSLYVFLHYYHLLVEFELRKLLLCVCICVGLIWKYISFKFVLCNVNIINKILFYLF